MVETKSPGESDMSAGHAGPLPPLPPDALIIVPVRSTVLFPGIMLPITIGRQRSIAAAQQAVRDQRPVGILMQRDPELVFQNRPPAIDIWLVTIESGGALTAAIVCLPRALVSGRRGWQSRYYLCSPSCLAAYAPGAARQAF